MRPTPQKKQQLILLNLLFWLSMTIIAASLYYLSYGDNYEGNWWTFFWRQLPIWTFWSIVSIPIFYLVRFLKRKKYRLLQQVGIHFLTFCVLFAGFYVFFMSYNLWLAEEEVSWKTIFQAAGLRFVLNYVLNLLVYLLVAVFVYAWLWYADLQKSELEKALIETQLQEAKLNMLTTQMQPHFLFNALNSIAGLMRKGDNARSIQAIADLGDLLRQSLQYQPQQFISLQAEIDFITQYLKMEALRFGDKLMIQLDIAADTKSLLVPALILQPLVENAIKHGIYKSQKAGKLQIIAQRIDGFLYLYIINDCPEQMNELDLQERKGMGITNTQERLATIYSPTQYLFKSSILADNKVQIFIKIPV